MKKQKTMIVQKYKGSKGWLIFWIIAFFPIAIFLYLTKRKPVEVKIE